MKRGKFDAVVSIGRLRSIQILMGVLFLYVVFVSLEIPLVLKTGLVIGLGSADIDSTASMVTRPINEGEIATDEAHVARSSILQRSALRRKPERRIRELKKISRLVFDEKAFVSAVGSDFSELQNAAMHAFTVGKKVWEEIESGKVSIEMENSKQNGTQSCPNSISLFKDDFEEKSGIVVIPCGLTLGSHITVVGKPGWAHPEEDSSISRDGEEKAMVSQFFMELQGLKTVDGEDPPRILHFNPRLKGDWSGRPVIEQNTCYRMQWGSSMRCEGWKSKADEETVDGQVKCERWIRDDDNKSEESKTIWWLKRLIGRTKKVTVDWPYPFAEGKLFVLTLRAGLEGYHVNVNGRHVTSFPYRPGFTLEDATGLSLKGDIDVHSVYAASLPMSHSSFAPQRHLEMAMKWQAPPLPDGSVELFIGVLSAGNHFAERMAVRKSWMQHESIKSSNVVARFFVALHGRKGVNLELIKEAEYFGDIIIVPYIDNYDLVVLKTLAICEFGVRSVAAKYIMKCDDDTFVRIDSVMKEAKAAHNGGRSLYVGNMNYYHKPLRHGKWAVTYQEWPEEHYPPYANGPGYVVSADIAEYIVSEFQRHKLRLFKMEDVSMGMWVEQFNSSTSRLGRSGVEYVHSLKFCQFGCIEDYYTAHYQSPRQMICLWNKLLQHQSNPRCCNMR